MGFSTIKLIALGIAAAAILSFIGLSLRWHSLLLDRDKEKAATCASVRSAADNPKMDCAQVDQQIAELGKSIVTLKTAIADQNAQVDALGKASSDQQAAAQEAVKAATGRAQAAAATSSKLLTSSRSGKAPAGTAAACRPSKTLEDAWR